MKDRVVLGAVALSLVVTAALVVRLIAIDKPAVVVILLPALAGALLAIRGRGRAVMVAAALLTALTAGVSLIGGVGLLYVPSIVLFICGAVSSSARQARAA